MKIIIDAMGGDHAPQAPVLGALQAKKELGCDILLVGQEDAVRAALKEAGCEKLPEGVELVHTTEVIEMCDDPATAWRKKKDSSMSVGLKLLSEGAGDAFISAGSTGALLSGATLLVRRIKGVKRAAVAPVVPTGEGGAIIIDAGANAECTPELLVQFAFMGTCYARITGNQSPRVGLLNIGTEPSKGTPLYQETYAILSRLGKEGLLNFIGNVEGREAVLGGADVIVADGFTGNIFLKTIEGAGKFFGNELKKIFYKSLKTKLGALMVKDGVSAFKKSIDYREVGGTALLGIQKPVIKAHGSSDAYAFRSAVKQAVQFAQGDIAQLISQQMVQIPALTPTAEQTEPNAQ